MGTGSRARVDQDPDQGKPTGYQKMSAIALLLRQRWQVPDARAGGMIPRPWPWLRYRSLRDRGDPQCRSIDYPWPLSKGNERMVGESGASRGDPGSLPRNCRPGIARRCAWVTGPLSQDNSIAIAESAPSDASRP